uniref:Cadherin domain-containing protein n=1 Tax=Timema cristinae TaxID=61476 RepID=A0A7R9D2J5_TIMCR|nr:unnamed protein product [Timema cristinae]
MPTGMERRKIVDTVDRDEVDELDDPPTPVCYFIVGGNEGDFFTIEPLRHEVMVAKELDREASKQHLILIKATEDCIHSPANQNFFDPTDDTYLKVIVEVEDINDNAPHFRSTAKCVIMVEKVGTNHNLHALSFFSISLLGTF